MDDGHHGNGAQEADSARGGAADRPPQGFAGRPIGAPPPGFGGSTSGAVGRPDVATAAPPPTRRPAAPAKRSIVPLVGLVVVALVLIGFGIAMTSGDEETPDPADAAEAFAADIDERDAAGACRRLTAEAQAALAEASGARCRDAFELLFVGFQANDPGAFDVVEVEVDGDTAILRYDWGPGAGELPMDLVDGQWRLREFGPGEVDATPSGSSTGEEAPIGSAAACLTELRTVETAVAAYEAISGVPPADAQTLVDERFLQSLPTGAAVEPDGTVVPAGDCA